MLVYRRVFSVYLWTGASEMCTINSKGVCTTLNGHTFGQLGTTVREIVPLMQRDVVQVPA